MLFNSWEFLLLFLPAVLLISSRLAGTWLLAWVVLSSYLFYAFAGHVWFLLPMLFTTALDFFLAHWISGSRSPYRKRSLLIVSLASNLSLLGFFKYSGLFVNTGMHLWRMFSPTPPMPHQLNLFNVILPAGISFYTFQTISYIVDVYRGQCPAEKNFFKFAGFVAFFPHLIAGPLTRHDQLIPQLTKIESSGIQPQWRAGIYLFAVGLIKKVLIADRIANLIDPILAQNLPLQFAAAWLCAIGFALQIYFDFSGYSDMAIGLARLFGIALPQNFDSPYKSRNPSEFWRRWHITLSQWLRDYLYISLGGNRCTESRRNLNLLITMFLGGLWHGASWTFAIWGLLHGLYLIAYRLQKNSFDRLPAFVQTAVTFLAVCFAWIFFRAKTFHQAYGWILGCIGRNGFEAATISRRMQLGTDLQYLAIMTAGALLVVFAAPNASHQPELESLSPRRQVALGLAFSAALIFMNHSSKFLYFQF